MVWLLVFSIYAAPSNAMNWNGPWTLGESRLMEQHFGSEAECRNSAIQFIGKLHQSMLAPMRFQCVRIEGALPKGAPR